MLLIFCIVFSACATSNTQDGYIIKNTVSPVVTQTAAPFSKGVNLSGWFQYANGAKSIPVNMYTLADFKDIKSLGADVIRLPLDLYAMTTKEAPYTLDPFFLTVLDKAVAYAEEEAIYLILDNHSSDGANGDTPETIGEVLVPVWKQMAEHFKEQSEFIIYEVMNEPYNIDSQKWAEIQGEVLAAIRELDTKHYIIVGASGWNSIDELVKLPHYPYEKLIYTFHFYDPFLFTHQGASWAGASMAQLAGIPFPPDSGTMPAVPADLEWNKTHYAQDGDPEQLARTLNKAAQFSLDYDVPVFCGEFGVYIPKSPPVARVRWYKFVTELLEERNIARTSWDYKGGFGIFKTESGGDFNSDLNLDIVKALGFIAPPQKALDKIREAFVLYDEAPASGLGLYHWSTEPFNMYDENAYKGDFAILWADAKQYNSFYFTFNKVIDWAFLKENGYAIQYYAKTSANISFDVRLVDSEIGTALNEVPWRLRYKLTQQNLPADGEWHLITIPLASMEEHGAWVNATEQWIEPSGKFDWNRIALLEFCAEYEGGLPASLWLDEIKVIEQ